jgi:VanZ family protein
MGSRGVRIVVIPKWVTAVLLVLVTGGMAAFFWALSGRAYATGNHPLRNLFLRVLRSGPAPSRDVLLAAMMPFAAQALIFVPWGFLFFALIDRPERTRARTYAMTVVAGFVLAFLFIAWQAVLPTRVITPFDSLASATGAFLGGTVAHLRRGVRIRFEI